MTEEIARGRADPGRAHRCGSSRCPTTWPPRCSPPWHRAQARLGGDPRLVALAAGAATSTRGGRGHRRCCSWRRSRRRCARRWSEWLRIGGVLIRTGPPPPAARRRDPPTAVPLSYPPVSGRVVTMEQARACRGLPGRRAVRSRRTRTGSPSPPTDAWWGWTGRSTATGAPRPVRRHRVVGVPEAELVDRDADRGRRRRRRLAGRAARDRLRRPSRGRAAGDRPRCRVRAWSGSRGSVSTPHHRPAGGGRPARSTPGRSRSRCAEPLGTAGGVGGV